MYGMVLDGDGKAVLAGGTLYDVGGQHYDAGVTVTRV
jgi:hypothetical protein